MATSNSNATATSIVTATTTTNNSQKYNNVIERNVRRYEHFNVRNTHIYGIVWCWWWCWWRSTMVVCGMRVYASEREYCEIFLPYHHPYVRLRMCHHRPTTMYMHWHHRMGKKWNKMKQRRPNTLCTVYTNNAWYICICVSYFQHSKYIEI